MSKKQEFVHGQIWINDAQRVGLGWIAHRWIHVVYLHDGDRAVVGQIPVSDIRDFKPITGRRQYETPQALARRMLRGRKVGQMTRAARRILEAARLHG